MAKIDPIDLSSLMVKKEADITYKTSPYDATEQNSNLQYVNNSVFVPSPKKSVPVQMTLPSPMKLTANVQGAPVEMTTRRSSSKKRKLSVSISSSSDEESIWLRATEIDVHTTVELPPKTVLCRVQSHMAEIENLLATIDTEKLNMCLQRLKGVLECEASTLKSFGDIDVTAEKNINDSQRKVVEELFTFYHKIDFVISKLSEILCQIKNRPV